MYSILKTCKTPQYTNIILRRNQFYYLLKDAAVKGVSVWGVVSEYISSLFAMLCSWSVVVFCLCIAFWDFYWLTVLPANSSKNWSIGPQMVLFFYVFIVIQLCFIQVCQPPLSPQLNRILSQNSSQKSITLLLLYQLYAIHPNIVDSDYISQLWV